MVNVSELTDAITAQLLLIAGIDDVRVYEDVEAGIAAATAFVDIESATTIEDSEGDSWEADLELVLTVAVPRRVGGELSALDLALKVVHATRGNNWGLPMGKARIESVDKAQTAAGSDIDAREVRVLQAASLVPAPGDVVPAIDEGCWVLDPSVAYAGKPKVHHPPVEDYTEVSRNP